jgi:OFA family oxalate/formate antiporter-like MFS transporter
MAAGGWGRKCRLHEKNPRDRQIRLGITRMGAYNSRTQQMTAENQAAVINGSGVQENRWLIAIMGTLVQVCLGTVYAWSYFQKPLVQACGWSNTRVAWAFCLAICFLGLAAAWGGVNLPKYGPRKLAMAGGALYGTGYLIAAYALRIGNLPMLYLGFGVVGGIGLGLGYVTPVATSAKWFPDKKGLVTGMVVMGFGLGALFMSKLIAPALMEWTGGCLVRVFALTGAIVLVLATVAGSFLHDPPAGYLPSGYAPPAADNAAANDAALTAGRCLRSSRFLLMWLIFFCNITAGIMLIGFQSPMVQALLKISNPQMDVKALAAAGATLIAMSSVCNGIGRLWWGGISDKIGRIQAFRLILGTQVAAFAALGFIQQPVIFGGCVCYILLCYGGGFGMMPSFVLDVFGSRLMPVVYGTILTAWSAGGIVGPQLAAYIQDTPAAHAGNLTFTVGALFLLAGFVGSLLLNLTPAPCRSSAGAGR